MKQNTVLFSIQGNASESVHFIFGTMHLANDDAYSHIIKARVRLEKCSHYFGEMDLGKISSDEMDKAFRFPEGKIISDLMTKKQFERIAVTLRKAFYFDAYAFKEYIPFFIQSMITENVLEKNHKLPLDYFLYQEAFNAGKVLGGIESPERQLEILKQIPLESQLNTLRKICRNTKKFRRNLKNLSIAYQQADIKKIYKMSKKQLGGIRKLLLTDRNETMANFIYEHLGVNSSFFALGAGHLAGKKGVIALLKSKGCKVEPVY